MRRTPSTLIAVALLMLAPVSVAQAAQPDQWRRWDGTPRDATINAVGVVGAGVFGSADGAGVFTTGSPAGPWVPRAAGLQAPGASTVHDVVGTAGGTLLASTDAGLFSAPQVGGNWSPLGRSGDRALPGGVRGVLLNDPAGTALTAAVAGSARPGVYVSSDAGANWDRAAGIPSDENVYHLAASPSGTPLYAAGDHGVFRSTDLGRTWVLSSDGIPPGEAVRQVAVQPDDASALWATTTASVYRSTDTGVTWQAAAGVDGQVLPAGAKRALRLTPTLGVGRAVVGTTSGAFATIDAGAHWAKMSSTTAAPDGGVPLGTRSVRSLAVGSTPFTLFAGTDGFGIFSTPLQSVETPTTSIAPSTGLKPGTRLQATFTTGGTAPFFVTWVWRRCSTNNSTTCTPSAVVAGATGSAYTIPTTDTGRVRYSAAALVRNLVLPGSVSDVSSPTEDANLTPQDTDVPQPSFTVSEQPQLSPTENSLPTPRLGQTFTLEQGKWRTSLNSTQIFPVFRYRWSRCDPSCEEIPNAVGASYTVARNDIGSKIRGEVAGTTSAGGSSAFFLAGTSGTVVNKVPVNQVAPAIVGDAVTGGVLGSAAGGWDGWALTYSRRWLRCEPSGLSCVPTENTTPTYALTAADVGKRLQLEATATADLNPSLRAAAVSGLSSTVVAAPEPGVPAGTGDLAPSATPGGSAAPPVAAEFTPVIKLGHPKKLRRSSSLSVPKEIAGFSQPKYQWLRRGKAIKRATKRTYRLTSADRGKKISCRVTLTRTSGTKVTVTTAAIKVPRSLK